MVQKKVYTFLPAVISLICGLGWSVASFYVPRNESYTPWRDEAEFHLPTIQKFAADFPSVNLQNYEVASTPGYHLLMAAAYRLTHSFHLLLIINAILSAICLFVLLRACNRINPLGWLWGLLILLSPNFHYSALYLRSDNASWLLVFLIIATTLGESFQMRRMIAGAVMLFILAIFRHVHIWAAAVLWAAAYFDRRDLRQLFQMVLLTLPAFVVVAFFFSLWHGLVPPVFQTVHGTTLPAGHSSWQHEGPNWSVPMFIVAVLGSMLIFYLTLLNRSLTINPKTIKLMCLAMLIMSPIALLPPSNWDDTHGRYSGLWNVAQHLPAPMQRSIFLIPLSILGAGLFVLLIRQLGMRLRLIAIATLIAFIAAQTANAMAWQKYYEPFLLGWLAMLVTTIRPKNPSFQISDG